VPEHDDTVTVDPTSAPPPSPQGSGRRRRLGELLIDAGVLTPAQLDGALQDSLPSERIGDTLQRLELADEQQIAQALGTQLGLEVVELTGVTPDPLAVDRVPARLAERHSLVPLRLEDDVLTIVMADPSNVVALDDVRVAASVRSVRRVVGVDSEVDRTRRRAYRADVQQGAIEEAAAPEDQEDHEAGGERDGDDQPIIRLVSSLISEAVAARASDIHVEPRADGVGVRLRVDGLLRETMQLPRGLGRQVSSRLKIMGSLDIAERRLPQDGRAVARVDGQTIDLRISTMPTLHGETVVLRLLPQGATLLSLTDLGLPEAARRQLIDALERPQGLVLVTGPTGSGKTTTLYAGLAEVSDPTRNVLTLEDPVEVQLPGVNQTQVESRIGLTFARGLRHVLRQDPDVVLVGEIRDQETAQLAVEASFTGHLVLATLHTNDAASAVARLVDLGADAFLIASSLQLVLAQRLARKVCDHCAIPEQPDPVLEERLGPGRDTDEHQQPRFRRGEGCSRCEGAGTLGRVAISESLVVSPELRELVVERAAERTLSHQARADGLVPLRREAATLARRGVITATEAVRVTPDVT